MQPDWEIWIDTNISPVIAKWIMDYSGYSVKSSYSLELNHKTDLEIYNLALSKGSVILISKDADFSELISRMGSPPKLINIKIGNCDNQTLWKILKPVIIDAIEVLTSSEVNIVDVE